MLIRAVSDAANGFSRCITPLHYHKKWYWPLFTKKFWYLEGGVRSSILVYDIVKKTWKKFFVKHYQVAYQQGRNDPLSRNLLIVLVYWY